MKTERIVKLALTACLFIYGIPLQAEIQVTPGPLESRIADSAIVCACSIVDLKNSSKGVHEYEATVIQAYKGAKPGSLLAFESDDSSLTLLRGSRYILLLKSPSVKLSVSAEDTLPIPSDFPVGPNMTADNSLEADLARYITFAALNADHSNKQDVTTMIDLLDQFKSLSPQSVAVLSNLADSSSIQIGLLCQRMLIARHIDSVRLFRALLSRLEKTENEQYPEMADLSTLFMQNANTSEIQDFEKLSQAHNLEVRRASIRAIRKLADPSTTAFLIKELDQDDPISQYTAVIALAEIYHKSGEYGPGLGPFEQDKEKYIQLWKKWYSQQNN